jgi:uncharacterized damage-inducible protein DinB
MAIKDQILPEFDHEMANTRKTLERVPDNKLAWQPHTKSYTMGKLASHIANIPAWIDMTLNQDVLDMTPKDGKSFTTPQAGSTKELLEFFDKNVAAGRAVIAACTDEQFGKSWSLMADGKTLFTAPRIVVLRGFVMNHNVHHRAQLGVYFRLNDIPVPSIYGPSADEQGM